MERTDTVGSGFPGQSSVRRSCLEDAPFPFGLESAGLSNESLFRLDPADQILLADRLQQGRMVGGQVPADHPDHLAGSGELITYCTIGGRAATAWFVLTHLIGRDRVRVYDGSWAEWGRLPGTPVEAP
jgi:rhodanese-related sulfurtransferase